MKPKAILLAACLLAGSVYAQVTPGDGTGSRQTTDVPKRFLRIDPVSFGPRAGLLGADGATPWGWDGTALKVTWQRNRFRLGAAAFGVIGGHPMLALPVHVGYDLVNKQVRTWFFYGAVPNVYAEVSASAFLPSVKPSLACDIDFYGVGLKAEVGVLVYWLARMDAALYATAQVRLLTFGIGF